MSSLPRDLRNLLRGGAGMIYDVSVPITPDLMVWPGDTAPTREVLMDMQRGDNLTLSTLRSTVHLGTHADAPSHYGLNAEGIGERALDRYIGLCQVVHVNPGPNGEVGPAGFPWLAFGVDAPRILIRTGTNRDPRTFRSDFASIAPPLIDRLASLGVRLIGVDTPSVDRFDSKDLPAHLACLRHDIAILEGLVLANVPVGLYELIALPLRLMGFDASPVRAILRTLANGDER